MTVIIRKILITILPALLLALAISPAAYAAEQNLVTDFSGVLTPGQREDLLARAETISARYRCDVAVAVVERMSAGDIETSAHDYYDDNGFGYGPESGGLLLYLSVGDREITLAAKGYGNTAFTDYGRDVILDAYILPQLLEDNYYGAFSAYLDISEEFLAMAREGRPFDWNTDPAYAGEETSVKLAVVIILPLLIAFITCSIWKSKMKTAKIAKTACNYIPEGGFKLTGSADMFIYRTVTRVKIESNSSSSRGGSSVNSRGFSSSSRKF